MAVKIYTAESLSAAQDSFDEKIKGHRLMAGNREVFAQTGPLTSDDIASVRTVFAIAYKVAEFWERHGFCLLCQNGAHNHDCPMLNTKE